MNRSVLITGTTGFLGSRILEAFRDAGYRTCSLNRSGGDIKHDLSEGPFVQNDAFDVVVHCAGKAHSVPKTDEEKKEFHKVNSTGTAHLLESLTKAPEVVVLISTVAVYGRETGIGIDEDHPLKGENPYALSKIEAERKVIEWCEARSVGYLILRLPLIAGTRPPGNLGKMISGIRSGRYFSIAGGKARRSVVMADDVALLLSRITADTSGIFNLTDGYHPRFCELEALIAKQAGKKSPLSIPRFVALLMGKAGDLIPGFPVNSAMIGKMTHDLTFDDQRAVEKLNWHPSEVLKHFRIE